MLGGTPRTPSGTRIETAPEGFDPYLMNKDNGRGGGVNDSRLENIKGRPQICALM